MKKKKRNGLEVPVYQRVIATVLLGIVGIIMLAPLVWMISTSFKVEADVFNFPIEWIPKRSRGLENYKDVWMGVMPFGLYYWNSIKVTLISVVASVVIGCMGAYGFSRIEFPGRDKLFLLYIATMAIPEQVTLIPRFLIFKQIGLFDTHACLIVNTMFSVLSVFMLRQSMVTIPDELTDAAKIDGAGHLRTLFQIVIPISKPTIATFGILKFVWTWNDYQNPLVFLTSSKLYTIQLGIKMFSDAYGDYYSLMMAAAVSAILPLLIIFVFGQKYIVSGLVAGSVKG
ncbi:MAG: carbohydrate ABC transporter permease [Lachnospiraceae bacterium]|nr:carbohydrate ABC transporter permease [Lachnospiraceae bacterium]